MCSLCLAAGPAWLIACPLLAVSLPLAVVSCRHSYVRRNAVLAIHSLRKLPKGDLLVPDADELIERFLSQEQDMSAKRNALIMLTAHAEVTAMRGRQGD